MFVLLYDFLCFICEFMSFSLTPAEMTAQSKIDEMFNNYDFVINNTPNLYADFNMGRYVTEEFINLRPYFESHYNTVYSEYLTEYILRVGSNLRLDEESAYMQVLFSTIKKIYVLHYTDSQLDNFDYYILDWAKRNMSLTEFLSWKDYIIANSNQTNCMYFHVDVKIL